MLGRRFYDPFLIGDYVDRVVSPLKPIARAIYESWPVKSARTGLGRIFRVPAFLQRKHTEQTQLVIYESFLTNIVKYLAPVVMYRRFVNTWMEKSPDMFDPIFFVADCVFTVAVFGRLFLRRLVDNGVNSINLPKAISKDQADYLAETISDGLAVSLSNDFSAIFSNTDASARFNQLLKNGLHVVFKNFFLETITTDAVGKLQVELEKEFSHIFSIIMQEFNQDKVTPEMAENLAKTLAKGVAEEFAKGIFSTDRAYSESELTQDITKILSKKMVVRSSEKYAKNLMRKISDTRLSEDVQLYLPDKSLTACNCKTQKKMQGPIASSLYYTGLTWLTMTPDALELFGWLVGLDIKIPRAVYVFTFALRSYLYGQSFNEARFTAAGMCTRHRYHVGAANKIRLTFEAMAYSANIEASAFVVKMLTGVDTIFTRDALANFLLPLHLIPAYALNEPLYQAKKNPFDVFLPGRAITRWTASGIKAWFLPDLNDKKERERCLNNIRNMLRSDKFSYAVVFLLGPSDFLPMQEWAMFKREKEIMRQISEKVPYVNLTGKLDQQRQDIVREIEILQPKRKAFANRLKYFLSVKVKEVYEASEKKNLPELGSARDLFEDKKPAQEDKLKNLLEYKEPVKAENLKNLFEDQEEEESLEAGDLNRLFGYKESSQAEEKNNSESNHKKLSQLVRSKDVSESNIKQIYLTRFLLNKLNKKINQLTQARDLLKELKQIRTSREPMRVLLDNFYVNLFFDLHESEISEKMEYAPFLRNFSNWIATPLAIFPVQGGIISLLELPVRFLKEDASQEIIRKIQSKLIDAKSVKGSYRLPEQEAKYHLIPQDRRLAAPVGLTLEVKQEVKKEVAMPLVVSGKVDAPLGKSLEQKRVVVEILADEKENVAARNPNVEKVREVKKSDDLLPRVVADNVIVVASNLNVAAKAAEDKQVSAVPQALVAKSDAVKSVVVKTSGLSQQQATEVKEGKSNVMVLPSQNAEPDRRISSTALVFARQKSAGSPQRPVLIVAQVFPQGAGVDDQYFSDARITRNVVAADAKDTGATLVVTEPEDDWETVQTADATQTLPIPRSNKSRSSWGLPSGGRLMSGLFSKGMKIAKKVGLTGKSKPPKEKQEAGYELRNFS